MASTTAVASADEPDDNETTGDRVDRFLSINTARGLTYELDPRMPDIYLDGKLLAAGIAKAGQAAEVAPVAVMRAVVLIEMAKRSGWTWEQVGPIPEAVIRAMWAQLR